MIQWPHATAMHELPQNFLKAWLCVFVFVCAFCLCLLKWEMYSRSGLGSNINSNMIPIPSKFKYSSLRSEVDNVQFEQNYI